MPPKLSLPHRRGHFVLFQNYPCGEGDCEAIERQKLSRGNFCPGTSRCLAGTSGFCPYTEGPSAFSAFSPYRVWRWSQRALRLKKFNPDWSREIFNPYDWNFQSRIENFNLDWNFQSRLKISIPTLIIPHKGSLIFNLDWNVQSRLKISIWDWSLESFNPGAKSWTVLFPNAPGSPPVLLGAPGSPPVPPRFSPGSPHTLRQPRKLVIPAPTPVLLFLGLFSKIPSKTSKTPRMLRSWGVNCSWAYLYVCIFMGRPLILAENAKQISPIFVKKKSPFQGGSGTEQEPEIGTVGTVCLGTESGTGTARTI